jgi:pimeloyl-ACP methyl ester carboxylesterase
MEFLAQSVFQEPSQSSDEPLIIHHRPESDHRQIIVLVHGLGGTRYGQKCTWGNIPSFLFEDFPQLDVGLYEYPTLFRRWKFWMSVPLETEAITFANLLRENHEYVDILLAGHSLGGLLCMSALQHFYTTNQREQLERIRGLYLMATPQTGSQRVPILLSWFSKDFYALRPHGRFVTDVQSTLTNAFSLDETLTSPDRILIPTWAILGNSDFWVDRLSASLKLPAWRCMPVPGSHRSIVKPGHKESDGYRFLTERIRAALRQKSDKQSPRTAGAFNYMAGVSLQPGHPPPPPALFIGREESLRDLKQRLGIVPKGRPASPGQPLTVIRGLAGLGKTVIARALANDSEVGKQFPLGSLLWAAIGQDEPNLVSVIASWGSILHSEPLLQASTLEQAMDRLRTALRGRRALLIIDDVWRNEDTAPLLNIGGDCAVVITTRLPEVADYITSAKPSAIYELPRLTEDNAFELFVQLAPDVASEYPAESRELVRDLEGLPLALHVAGRLLNSEFKIGLGVTKLLSELREGKQLLEANAPADRIELRTQTIPTVDALLRKSTDCLDEYTRKCFAQLGFFAAKPATFNADAMKDIWEVDDPRDIIGVLVNRGLLEPDGTGRFQMHALLKMHAQSFFPPGVLPC